MGTHVPLFAFCISHQSKNALTMIAMKKEEKVNELLNTNSLFYKGDKHSELLQIQQAEKDFDIIQSRLQAYDQVKGPRVGDFLNISYGKYVRFTHHWGDSIQTGPDSSGYCLTENSISYSGSLDPSIPIELFEPYEYEPIKEGQIWAFSNGWAGAGRGVYLNVPFRVFQISQQKEILNKIGEQIKNDRLPEDHPLFICDNDSSQWKGALTEYYFYRASYKLDKPIIKGCEINRSNE